MIIRQRVFEPHSAECSCHTHAENARKPQLARCTRQLERVAINDKRSGHSHWNRRLNQTDRQTDIALPVERIRSDSDASHTLSLIEAIGTV